MMSIRAMLSAVALVALAPCAAAAAPAAEASRAQPADPIAEALSAYAAWQNDVADLREQRLTRAADVEAALDRIASTNSDVLTRGFIAYAALTAAKQPAFADEVRKISAAYGADVAARGFSLSGAYAASIRGGAEARQAALATAHVEGARLYDVGDQVKTRAMSLSGAGWAKARATSNRTARLTRLRNLFASSSPRTLDPALSARLSEARAAGLSQDPAAMGGRDFWDALRAGDSYASLAAYTPTPAMDSAAQQESAVEAVLSVAALSAMNGVDRISRAELERVLNHAPTRDCFERARLQFIQCVSAGEFHYENAACVGEAGLQTRGLCLRNISKPRSGSVASVN